MKINETGRTCNTCGEYKVWDEYGNKKSGLKKKQPSCRQCTNAAYNRRIAVKRGETPLPLTKVEPEGNLNGAGPRPPSWILGRVLTKTDHEGRVCSKCCVFKSWLEYASSGRKGNNIVRHRTLCKDCTNENTAKGRPKWSTQEGKGKTLCPKCDTAKPSDEFKSKEGCVPESRCKPCRLTS